MIRTLSSPSIDSSFSVAKIVCLCLIICESDGLVSAFLGFDSVLAAWLFSAFMSAFAFLSFYLFIKVESLRETKFFYYPILVFAVFIIVSFISANFIFLKSTKDWLPSLYAFAPIFIFYYLYFFKYSRKEIIYSIICVSVFVSILLLIDSIVRFSFLDPYFRRSAFFNLDVRRIVVLKNEVIFGFVAVVSLLISGDKGKNEDRLLIVIAVGLFLVQAIIMESRMGFMAMAVASLTLLYVRGITKRVLSLYMLGFVFVLLVIPFIFSEHIEKLSQMSLHDSESNISVRFETTEHFYQLFLETKGVGIGSMSSTGMHNNVLFETEHRNIVDIGFFSALFQFGLVGFLAYVVFTYQSLRIYYQYYIYSRKTDPFSSAAFAFIMSFTFSLLPLSFFTATWCVSLGGILLYLAWSCHKELMSSSRVQCNDI